MPLSLFSFYNIEKLLQSRGWRVEARSPRRVCWRKGVVWNLALLPEKNPGVFEISPGGGGTGCARAGCALARLGSVCSDTWEPLRQDLWKTGKAARRLIHLIGSAFGSIAENCCYIEIIDSNSHLLAEDF